MQSTRDPNRLYFEPLSPAGPDVIHFHCVGEYVDPANNIDIIESIRTQLEPEMRQQIEEEMMEMEAFNHSDEYGQYWDQFVEDCQEQGWLSPQFYIDNPHIRPGG